MASIPFLSNAKSKKQLYSSVPDSENLDDDEHRDGVDTEWRGDAKHTWLKSPFLVNLGINTICAALCAAGLYLLGARITFGPDAHRDNVLLPLELRQSSYDSRSLQQN